MTDQVKMGIAAKDDSQSANQGGVLDMILSFVAGMVKGPFYFYMLIAGFIFLVMVCTFISHLLGSLATPVVNFLSIILTPIALVIEFCQQLAIDWSYILLPLLFFIIAGMGRLGDKIVEWRLKRKLSWAEDLLSIIAVSAILNIAISIGFASTSIFSGIIAFIILSFVALICIVLYEIGSLIDHYRITVNVISN